MEETNQQQTAPERKYKLHHYDPSRPLKEQRIIWDEAAKKRIREIPFSLDLDFELDIMKLCNGGYELDEDE